ncbi:MAG: hypothetical protein EP329_26890 [Deltaproteobacteria bacterium]|nr:MAG: hypothetical protein EP329_26890 [Deltaproteobacteria bacterium]
MSMSRGHITKALLVGLVALTGCGSDGDTLAADGVDATTADDTAEADVTAHDTVVADTLVADTAEPLTAGGYCEAVADAYCAFYLRCDRMAVPDEATCRTVFAEVCNALYEPQYVALEARGLLSVDAEAVAACQAHLETVACALQPGDLDGPCRDMWQGQAGEGAACSYGIESLVCDGETTCVLGLDFCGTCEPAADVGEPCGGDAALRCHDDAACVGGTCVARALPTEACSDSLPCRVGASCVDRVCVSPAIVAVGDACDQTHRCPYKAACVGGTCVETALLGEACGDAVPCADGACDGQVCVQAPAFSTGCLDP